MTERRRPIITLERATVVTDAYGEEVRTWSTLATEYARVHFGRGDERRQAAMEQGSQAATFVVRDNPATRGATLTDRISYDGGLWDIRSNVPGAPGEREIDAVRAV